jgi:hypothetical protein
MTGIDLSVEIAAFMKQKPALIRDFGASWVVFVQDVCRGHFSNFQDAARFAVENLASGPFLIRHTDDLSPQVPMFIVED